MCKKKLSALFAVWIFSTLLVFLMTERADAFCAYNNSDTQIRVVQTSDCISNRGANWTIDPGLHGCCHWKEKSCNTMRRRDSTVEFYVYHQPYLFAVVICKDFPIKAGGWLSVSGKNGSYQCEAYFDESSDKDSASKEPSEQK